MDHYENLIMITKNLYEDNSRTQVRHPRFPNSGFTLLLAATSLDFKASPSQHHFETSWNVFSNGDSVGFFAVFYTVKAFFRKLMPLLAIQGSEN